MTSILTLLIGSLSALAPELFKIWGRKQDNAQEYRMAQLQFENARDVALIHSDTSAQEGANQAYAASLAHDTAVADAMNQNQNFFIRFLGGIMNIWRAAIRPGVTTLLIFVYCAVKHAQYQALEAAGKESYEIVMALWTYQDWELLTLVIGYWFTSRGIKKSYGLK